MSVIETTNFTYIPGTLTIERTEPNRFKLEGNWSVGLTATDHMQLIYEALEIAAHSNDKFKQVFAAFVTEFMELTSDWDD